MDDSYLRVHDVEYVEEFNGVPYVEDVPEGKQVYGVAHGGMFGMMGWKPTDVGQRFRFGQCHALALAILMERPGWRLMMADDEQHFVVDAGPGRGLLDVSWLEGEPPEDGWEEDEEHCWERLRELVMSEQYALPVIDEVTRETARTIVGMAERR